MLCTNKVIGDSARYHPKYRSLRPSWRNNNRNKGPLSSTIDDNPHKTGKPITLALETKASVFKLNGVVLP